MRSNGTLAALADAGGSLQPIVQVLESLPADNEPLPVLNERLLGDTKALATGRKRTLLLRALSLWRDVDYPDAAEIERELLEWAGIVSDDMASQVLVLNLPIHGGVTAEWMRSARGIPFRLTLHQLRLQRFTVTAPIVWVVENPSILRAAANTLGSDCPPLVCTEGIPSAALYRLLGAASNSTVRWRADFDWTGLRIVQRGLGRFTNAEPWRMATTDYRSGALGIPLRGNQVSASWDQHLAPIMAETGRAVMEESLLPTLLDDLNSWSA